MGYRNRVLIAEDDFELRALIARAFAEDGYYVLEVENGRELFDLLAGLVQVDLVVSDVRMPGGSGLAALAGFRKRNPSTPFVIITAFGNEALHQEARRLGATAVVDKPFEMDDLRALARRLSDPNSGPGDVGP